MCVVCVHVYVGACVCVCVNMRVCVCVCICAWCAAQVLGLDVTMASKSEAEVAAAAHYPLKLEVSWWAVVINGAWDILVNSRCVGRRTCGFVPHNGYPTRPTT